MKRKTLKKESLCETCKNNFVSKSHRYYKVEKSYGGVWFDKTTAYEVNKDEININELYVSNRFCVYTHDPENAIQCSFYNKEMQNILLEIPKRKNSDTDSEGNFTNGVRFINIPGALLP